MSVSFETIRCCTSKRTAYCAADFFPRLSDFRVSVFRGYPEPACSSCDEFDSGDAVTGKRWVHLDDDGSVMSVSNHE
jgi:hypothetical protein